MALSKEEKTLPVLLAYRKTINRRKDATGPEKEVMGNVILFISERTVNFFNIPVYRGEIPMFTEVKGFERIRDRHTSTVSAFQRSAKYCSAYSRKVKIIYKIDYYRIAFPFFFTMRMISESLYFLLQKNKNQRRFQVLPSQKKQSIYVGDEEKPLAWVPKNAQLITPRNIEDSPYPPVALIGKSSIAKRTKKKAK